MWRRSASSSPILVVLALAAVDTSATRAAESAVAAHPAPPVTWIQREGFRETSFAPRTGERPGFTLLGPRTTGLDFTNSIPESRHLTNQVLLNGSGLAAGDVDGDGWSDVFCAGFDNDSALFRNIGNWRFENITARSGTALTGLDCTGAAFADLDGDSDLDLVVNTLAQGTIVLHNDGQGNFRQVVPPLHPGHGAMTVAIADVDADGFLDLYIANYRTRALMDMPNTRMTFKKVAGRNVIDTVNGRPATDPEWDGRFSVNAIGGIEEHGEPDVLFRGVGGTNFVAVSWTDGTFLDETGKPLVTPPRDWGLAAMFRDVNLDGRPDLYVCNDFHSPDRLWLGQGRGRFRLAPPTALRRTSLSSMAVDFADLDGNGHDDLFVVEMMSRSHPQRLRWVRENFPHVPVVGRYDDRPQLEQNTLQLARGDGTWAEVAQLAGIEATEWAWGCAFVDVDLDGLEDLLVVNGMERAGRDLDAAEQLRANRKGRQLGEREVFEARRIFPRLATPNVALRNQGDLTFRDVSREWGFDLAAVSQAIALADMDNDGDLDVLVGNLNAPVAVYRNEATAPRLGVRLAGKAPNTRGIGARIELVDGSRSQSRTQEMIAGGRYLSGDDPIRSFAVHPAKPIRVRVRWPDGRVTEAKDVRPDTLVEISEAAANGTRIQPPPTTEPWFQDVSSMLGHRHHEEPFDDFARQPLLPRKTSQPGPGVAWIDLDLDGDDDLIVGSGLRGRPSVFRNAGSGRLAPWISGAPALSLPRDMTAILVFPSPTRPSILAALANDEDGTTLGASVVGWTPENPAYDDLISATDSSPGPLALADIDGDGDLDLFVGGRVLPGRWPEAASSRFYRWDRGRFVLDAQRSRELASIGMVTAALFSDLDNDGDADLALAIEGGPPTILRQESSGFTNVTESLGLALTHWRGPWTSIAGGDFDNDGRMDLVLGNWGRNTAYERFRPTSSSDTRHAIQVLHGDLDGDGVHDVIETVYAEPPAKRLPLQPLNTLATSLRFMRGRFPSHAAFSQTGIEECLGDFLPRAKTLNLERWESVVLLNRGNAFEPRPLPIEAQVSPVFGIAIADADGDGDEDVFLAQNFFATRPHAPRCDGGAGLWLAGDGRGAFTALPPGESGVAIHGEQRGAAVADFDRDGRVDLVVGQNGAETRLFRNLKATPAPVFRLVGTPENPAGIGTRLRWKSAATAAREIRLGNGYLSQDALALPLARPSGAVELEAIWPGNHRVTYRIPLDTRSGTLRRDGEFAPD